MILHIVLVRWKETTSDDEVRRVEARFQTLESIEGVNRVTVRRNLALAKAEYTRGIGTVLIVQLTDVEALKRFGPHPTHRDLAEHFMPAADQVTVVDLDEMD